MRYNMAALGESLIVWNQLMSNQADSSDPPALPANMGAKIPYSAPPYTDPYDDANDLPATVGHLELGVGSPQIWTGWNVFDGTGNSDAYDNDGNPVGNPVPTMTLRGDENGVDILFDDTGTPDQGTIGFVAGLFNFDKPVEFDGTTKHKTGLLIEEALTPKITFTDTTNSETGTLNFTGPTDDEHFNFSHEVRSQGKIISNFGTNANGPHDANIRAVIPIGVLTNGIHGVGMTTDDNTQALSMYMNNEDIWAGVPRTGNTTQWSHALKYNIATSRWKVGDNTIWRNNIKLEQDEMNCSDSAGVTMVHIRPRSSKISGQYGSPVLMLDVKNSGPSAGISLVGDGNRFWNADNGGTTTSYITAAGAVGGTSHPTISSFRSLKKNIMSLAGAVDRVKMLNPVSFDYKEDGPNSHKLGFVIEDLETAMPEALSRAEGEVDGPEKGTVLGYELNPIVAALTAAVKELTARVEALE